MNRSRLVILAWVVLMTLVLLTPALFHSPAAADIHVRGTVDVALLFYALAAAGMLLISRDQWPRVGPVLGLVRLCWSLAWLAFVVHVTLAFHNVHRWSHEDAVNHTREVSGVGAGIFVSHAFTVLWGLDVVWWWLRPTSYGRRPRWIDWVLHAFMAFIIFCGTIIYESGPIRWAAATGFLVLGILFTRRSRTISGRKQLRKCEATPRPV